MSRGDSRIEWRPMADIADFRVPAVLVTGKDDDLPMKPGFVLR